MGEKKKSRKVSIKQKAEVCSEPTAVIPRDPLEAVVRLTETELLKLGKISAEVRLEILSARMAVFEAQEIRSKAEAEVRKREEEMKAWAQTELEKKDQARTAHLQEANRLRQLHDHLTAELAKKYGIEEPNSMLVDPETGVVRDKRNL